MGAIATAYSTNTLVRRHPGTLPSANRSWWFVDIVTADGLFMRAEEIAVAEDTVATSDGIARIFGRLMADVVC
jgi:hypothetical protein